MKISEEDHKLVSLPSEENNNSVYIRNLSTLELFGTIFSNATYGINNFTIGENKVFIKAGDEVISYDINSLSILNTWAVKNYFGYLDFSNNYLYYHSITPYIIGFAIKL